MKRALLVDRFLSFMISVGVLRHDVVASRVASLRFRLSVCGRMSVVAHFRQVSLAVLILVVTGVPTLACYMPDAQLTAEERDCCRQMADMCGRGQMPSSHSCCKTTLRSSDDARVEDTHTVAPIMQVSPAVIHQRVGVPVLVGIPVTISVSPPESPPRSLPVLRI